METATFAPGSGWGAEPAFCALDGVGETRLGVTEEPDYEAIEVDYDPWRISYDELLDVFWAEHASERPSAIFPRTVEQHVAAEASLRQTGLAAELVTAGGRFRRSAPS